MLGTSNGLRLCSHYQYYNYTLFAVYKLVVIKSQLPTQTQMTHGHNILYMYVLHTIYKRREKEETTDTSNALLAGATCTTTVVLPCARMRSRVKRLVPSTCIFICVYICYPVRVSVPRFREMSPDSGKLKLA